ncbi:SsrA-binding protein SmpB [Candidatus Palauibacter sp.]|uniref:SsrA-binding protein SmpB n=1 Tax=Candidatus Palauibacter sp. TaxID=3101350 RepID=UPI003CC53AFC
MAEPGGVRVIARNRKARHEYEVLEQVEAGIVLRGAEVKSLRDGKASFVDAFGRIDGGEAWLHNLHISPYEKATIDAPDPVRPRKLLLRRREIDRLNSKTREGGLTLVPLDIHFRGGFAKVTLGLARGKKHRDRREDLKRRTMQREVERAKREAARER